MNHDLEIEVLGETPVESQAVYIAYLGDCIFTTSFYLEIPRGVVTGLVADSWLSHSCVIRDMGLKVDR